MPLAPRTSVDTLAVEASGRCGAEPVKGAWGEVGGRWGEITWEESDFFKTEYQVGSGVKLTWLDDGSSTGYIKASTLGVVVTSKADLSFKPPVSARLLGRSESTVLDLSYLNLDQPEKIRNVITLVTTPSDALPPPFSSGIAPFSSLDLGGNRMDAAAVKFLARRLGVTACGPSLDHLGIGGNPIIDFEANTDALKCLLDAISVGQKQLSSLCLRDVGIGPTAAIGGSVTVRILAASKELIARDILLLQTRTAQDFCKNVW